MAEPFLSEIRLFSFNFPPKGWALAAGQLLPISQNQALFSLFGTTYGGNGQTNFALPDLRGRVPMHTGNGHTLGEQNGDTTVTLSIADLPDHVHQMNAVNSTATSTNQTDALLGAASIYAAAQILVAMNPNSITLTGASQPHENMQPFLTLNYCIALQGIFPSRN